MREGQSVTIELLRCIHGGKVVECWLAGSLHFGCAAHECQRERCRSEAIGRRNRWTDRWKSETQRSDEVPLLRVTDLTPGEIQIPLSNGRYMVKTTRNSAFPLIMRA